MAGGVRVLLSVDEESARQPLLRVSHARSTESVALRTLYATPAQAAEWKEDYEERVAHWSELFVDLVIVVAFTNIADALYESDESLQDFALFALTMNLVQSGWLLYATYSARFIDESFTHSVLLFLLILGLAGMAIHVGESEFVTEFTVSMLVQKGALLLMYATAAFHSARVRNHMGFVMAVIATSAALCVALLLGRPSGYTPTVLAFWALVLALELPYDLYAVLTMHITLLVPLNIDHIVDRQNAFIMVALGESVLSAMIKYGAVPSEARTPRYYACMSLVLLTAFSVGLVYYHVQPPRKSHAYRQSRVRGFAVYFTTCALAMVVLLLGGGVKHAMHSIIYTAGEISPFHTWLMLGGVAMALHLIFWLRCAHYWGGQPTPLDTPRVRTLKWAWWAVVALWPLVPVSYCAWAVQQPGLSALWTLAGSAWSCIGLALAETLLTHLLMGEAEHNVDLLLEDSSSL